MAETMLVVSAHAADFVWRAAGAVALHTAAGGSATVVCLSYGERGESGDLWREPGQTVEAVKVRRHAEGAKAAAEVGADYVPLDLGDYPLEVPPAALRRLADIYLDVRPQVLLIHAPADPFNPDHPVASAAAAKARLLAMGAGGVPAAFPTIPPPRMLAFEPHQPDQCGFAADVFLDITPVFARKQAAMAAMASQSYLADHYRQRAEQRAYQSRYLGAGTEVRYAEAYQRMTPELRTAL
ncbi:PIG-L deacetylase family protein [Polymorphospora lycopeni]|uniref:PIG-L deacetylase family protein n=1 Tax=Polymorphospora lycopeni TaxID=3140240 RepID=A0ABV5CV24_9ACTN